jgi:hypothetical protein
MAADSHTRMRVALLTNWRCGSAVSSMHAVSHTWNWEVSPLRTIRTATQTGTDELLYHQQPNPEAWHERQPRGMELEMLSLPAVLGRESDLVKYFT